MLMKSRLYLLLLLFTLIFSSVFSQTNDLITVDNFRISNIDSKELRLLTDTEILTLRSIEDKPSQTNLFSDENSLYENISYKISKESYSNPKNIKVLPPLDTNKYHREYPQYNRKWSLLIPAAEGLGFNIGLALMNNYIGQASFAKISFKSVKHNLDTGFVWDNDKFSTNQFGHPYHGGLFFAFARSSGYSFWESAPFALFGSMEWELFMETDPPQTNDIINTSIGGLMYGEMLYRMSSLVLDESKRGTKRLVNEILGTIISPARGLNRLFRGDMWRVTPKNVYDVFPVYSEIRLGYAGINPNEQIKFEKHHFMFEFNFWYGDPFAYKTFKPWDNFRFKAGFDTRKGDLPSLWIYSYGLLYGKNVISNPKSRFILGVFQDYDYYDNQLLTMGLQSFGPGFIYISPVNKKWKFFTEFHTNFVAIAALNSIYTAGEYRNYDWMIGNKTMLEATVEYGPAKLGLEYKVYFLKTINGAPGNHTVGMFSPKLNVLIYRGIGIGAEYILYHRSGTFEGVIDNYSKRTSEQRLYMSYTF